MAQPSFDVLLQIAAALGASGWIKTALDAWGKRQAKATASPAEILEAGAMVAGAHAEAVKELLADYRDQLGFVRTDNEKLAGEVGDLRRELRLQGEAHAAELQKAHAEHAGCREALERVGREISNLKAEARRRDAHGRHRSTDRS